MAGYVRSKVRALAVVIMCAVLACTSIGFPTVVVNPLDLAPLHAGKILGLTYVVANLASFAGPQAVSALTYQRATNAEWRNVFLLTTGIYVVGAVVFVIFGSANLQSWADDSGQDELRNIADRNKH